MPSDAHDATDGALPPPSRLPAPTRLPAPIGAAARVCGPGSTRRPTPSIRSWTAASRPRAPPPRPSPGWPRPTTRGALIAPGSRLVRLVRARGLPAARRRRRRRVPRRRAPARPDVNTLDLRRAAIRYLHCAAGARCRPPRPGRETLAGIRRDAAAPGELPAKKTPPPSRAAPDPRPDRRRPARPARPRPAVGRLCRRAAPLRTAPIRVEHLEATRAACG